MVRSVVQLTSELIMVQSGLEVGPDVHDVNF